MSTIIECPACSTRYKMNKAVPEGGRSVKCARCGHQWRLVPEGADQDEASETREEDGNSVAGQEEATAQTDMPQGAQAAAGEDEDAAANWEARREQFAAAMSSIQEEQAGHAEHRVPTGPAAAHVWEDREASAADHISNGHPLATGEAGGSYVEDDANWADRVQQSWREAEDRRHEAVGGDNPEVAVRQALKNALDHPEEHGVQADTAGLAEPFDDFWQGFSAETETEESRLAYGDKGAEAVAAEIENARRSSVIYDPNAVRHGYSTEEADDALDPGIQSGIAQAFSEPTPSRSAPRQELLHDETLTDYDAGFTEEGGIPRGEELAEGELLDRDAAAIQAELEGFGHIPYEEPRYAGLALVAAWAVFLSLVSGIILAMVNFRDNIMAALPGTTRLYQTVGFDITDRRIDFGDVSYRWSVANGKPMVEVQGQIINRTNRQITVPRVKVNVSDTQTSDVMKALASIRSEPLAAREVADFTLELVLPSRTVSQIELEFDRVQ